MSRLISFLSPVAIIALASLTASSGCSDEETTEPPGPTLAETLVEVGVPPGNWRVDSGGNSVCIRTFTAPGNVTATESIGLSGFGTFELRVSESEALSIRGSTDELAARWTEADCVEFDAGVDEVVHLENCPASEPSCPPFDLVQLCANGGSPTLFARVPDCGQNTFPAVAQ